jgi:endonuclease/exonuclease/phosphatase family metal-dependent hydrolase
MRRFIFIVCLLAVLPLLADDSKQYVVATWNMKWLGGSVGALDDSNNTHRYVNEVLGSNATIFALQEVTPSHSDNNVAKCHYLDLIVSGLKKHRQKWTYYVDLKNESQRLGFLYDPAVWTLIEAKSITPGSTFNGKMRKPLLASFSAAGNPNFILNIINIHLKAFPDGKEIRENQFEQLAEWLKKNNTGAYTIICGDTNIYNDEADPAIILKDAGFTEGKSSENTAIYNNSLSQRFDRFYLCRALVKKIKSSGGSSMVDSKQESANGNYRDYASNVSDHFPVTFTFTIRP